MEIKMIRCPCCGAQLDVDEKNKRSRCKYCGSQFFIEDDEIEVCENSEQKEEKNNAANIQSVSTGYSESMGIAYSSGYARHYTSFDDQSEQEISNFSDDLEKVSVESLNKHNGLTSSDESELLGKTLKIILSVAVIVLLSFGLSISYFSFDKISEGRIADVIQEIDDEDEEEIVILATVFADFHGKSKH